MLESQRNAFYIFAVLQRLIVKMQTAEAKVEANN